MINGNFRIHFNGGTNPIYKAYKFQAYVSEYHHNSYGLKYGTNVTQIFSDKPEGMRRRISINRKDFFWSIIPSQQVVYWVMS